MIEITSLYKTYGKKQILQDININFKKNSISFIMGKNGSGKTTLIKCLLDLEKYTGLIKYDGKEINECRNSISVLFDDSPFFLNLSGIDNIKMLINKSINKKTIIELASSFLSEDTLKKKVKKYSYGQKKKLNLIILEINKPKFIIMDEISNGLDYETMTKLKEKMLIWKNHSTIILTGHQFDFYNDMVNDVYYIKDSTVNQVDLNSNNLSLGDIYEKYVK